MTRIKILGLISTLLIISCQKDDVVLEQNNIEDKVLFVQSLVKEYGLEDDFTFDSNNIDSDDFLYSDEDIRQFFANWKPMKSFLETENQLVKNHFDLISEYNSERKELLQWQDENKLYDEVYRERIESFHSKHTQRYRDNQHLFDNPIMQEKFNFPLR